MKARKTCGGCRALISFDALFCPHCGVRQKTGFVAHQCDDDPLIGQTIDNKYRILESIGRGGMAVVYRAQEIKTEREVALKLLTTSFDDEYYETRKRRFQNEAALGRRLNHPNTVAVYDYGATSRDEFYIAMELIKGVTLKEEMKKYPVMAWRRACRIAADIGRSLHDAHENNIVHRDLKPDNVMLTWEEGGGQRIKVLDFGIAKFILETEGDEQLGHTSPNELFGTPEYMSPEYISGKPLDRRTDIYSLGIILYRMVTGVLPFEAMTPMLLLTCHIHERPRPFRRANPQLRALPPKLETLVMSMLRKKPWERPPTMNCVVEELDALAKDRTRGFRGWTPSLGIPIGHIATRRSSVTATTRRLSPNAKEQLLCDEGEIAVYISTEAET